jgi:hypothetical protein
VTPTQQQYSRVILVWLATLAVLFIVQQFFSRV